MKRKGEIYRAMEICRAAGRVYPDQKQQEMYFAMGTALSWVLECNPELNAVFEKGLDAAERAIYDGQAQRN